MTINHFSDLGLADPLQRALRERNHSTPTPIQARAIPDLLAGRDMLGIAQTGTGKTAAFALPVLHNLSQKRAAGGQRHPRALVLAPTRELAIQIGDEFGAYSKYGHLRHTVIFGGVGQNPQVKALRRGVDIVIATPGRLLDLMSQGCLSLKSIEILVLDEADRMLDMGFVRDVRKIVAAASGRRQSLLFSATMPKEILKLSREILTDPLRVEVTRQGTPVEQVKQSVYHVDASKKRDLLARILNDRAMSRVIVFTRTKHRANRLADQLGKTGVAADAIHGNKSQSARQSALNRFRTGRARVLVATDIAARGIDVSGITHVINFELPAEPESYVHRIGRTARAGADGEALSFCDPSERGALRGIERLINRRLTEIDTAPGRGDSKVASDPGNGQNRKKPHRKRRRRGRGHDGAQRTAA